MEDIQVLTISVCMEDNRSAIEIRDPTVQTCDSWRVVRAHALLWKETKAFRLEKAGIGRLSFEGEKILFQAWRKLWGRDVPVELWKMRFLNSIVPWLYSWSSFNSVFRSSFNSIFSWVVVPSGSIVIWSFRAYAVRETVADLCTWLV